MPKFYATTPIYYVNDAPHIGHAYTTVIGDALCRWHRLLGDDVLFLTGTDEYGLKNQQAAEAQGTTPLELADRNSARFRAAWDVLDIRYDDFIRTTEERHRKAVQTFLQAVYDNGDIEQDTYEGLYCVACEAYYTEDELVDGNCPDPRPPGRAHDGGRTGSSGCPGTSSACSTGTSRTPTPSSPPPGATRCWASSARASRTSPSAARPSTGACRCRGTPTTWPGCGSTPCRTTSPPPATASDDEAFATWWPADYHLIGKDIIRFHAVYWPAMLMAAGLEPPRCVAAHGWLLVKGEKMSKSKLNQIAPADLVGDLGVDAVRYHFLREVPFGPDGDFSYEGMVARYNADLANNLGNLLSRVATLVGSKCGGIGPAAPADSRLAAVADVIYGAAAAAWDRLSPSDALEASWQLIREANAHLEDNEPWKSEPGPEVDAVLGAGIEALRIVAILASPAMPGATGEVWRRLGLPGVAGGPAAARGRGLGGYPGGLPVEKGKPLFPRR